MLLEKWDGERIEVRIKGKRKIKSLLEELGIDLKNYIILKNGEVAIEEDYICNEDKIELIPIASGG